MKRSRKLLLLLLVLTVTLAGTYGATRLNPENGESGTDEAEQKLFSLSGDQVTSLCLDSGAPLCFEKNGADWHYTGDSDFPVNTAYLEKILTAFCDVTVRKTIDSPQSLDEYGLIQPACVVTAVAGETYTLSIGSETAMGGERYLSVGDGRVYLGDSGLLDSFCYELLELVKKEVIPAMEQVQRFTVSSGSKSYELDYLEGSGLSYSDDYVWFLREGDTYKALDTLSAESLVSAVTGLSWGDCVSYQVSPEELAAYGLAEPKLTVQVDYTQTVSIDTGMTTSDGEAIHDTQTQSKSFTLQVGDYAGESCYARIADSPMVYQVDAKLCDRLFYATYEQLQPDEVLLMDFSQVESLELVLEGQGYTLRRSTGQQEDGEAVNIWTLEDREVDIQELLNQITALTASDKGTAKTTENEAQLSLIFHRDRETFPEVELMFYPYDSDHFLVSLNGEARLLVKQNDVTPIIDGLKEAMEQEEENE